MNLRKWLYDLLTASRYCQSLEQRLVEQRQDYETRLAEKDARIKELKTDLAGLKLESDRMRLVLMPLGSPSGAIYASQYQRDQNVGRPPLSPAFDGPLDWTGEMQRLIQEEDNGLSVERRQEIHQSTADDAA